MVASLCEMRHLADTCHLSKEAYLRKTPKNGKSRRLNSLLERAGGIEGGNVLPDVIESAGVWQSVIMKRS